MTRYLLDTNIVSELVRHPHGPVALRALSVADGGLCTSIIVAAELRYGAARRNAARLTAQLDAVLGALDILPLEPPCDLAYGQLRTALELRGLPIGANDMLIAAQALALGLVLVTGNEREFRRVDGLMVENWLR